VLFGCCLGAVWVLFVCWLIPGQTSGTRVAQEMTTLTIMCALPQEVGTVCVRGGVFVVV
jgi:hypothetical protein